MSMLSPLPEGSARTSRDTVQPVRPDGGTGIHAEQINELLYQALETERGGTKVYETALRCAVNDELRDE